MASPKVPSRFPFEYPKGWFQILWSDELSPLQAVTRSRFGRELIVWRDNDGRPVVNDAFCPHLGAHLGVGGVVTPSGLRCPFHGWTFNSDGILSEVPYTTREIRKEMLQTMPCAEDNGHILVWNGPPGQEPEWSVPHVEEFGSESWGEYFTRSEVVIKSCCQELSENITDINHVPILHQLSHIESMSVDSSGPNRTIRITEAVTTPLGINHTDATIECLGLGYMVVRFASAVEICSISSVTPVDLTTVQVNFSWLIKREKGRPRLRRVGQAIADETLRILREDATIWENKAYLERPLLLPEDAHIRQFRAWAKQFYY